MKKNPISIQFLMVVKKVIKGYTDINKEHFEQAESFVLLANEGALSSYPIENRESESDSESDSFYVDFFITNMDELKKQKKVFEDIQGIFLEHDGKLVKVNNIIKYGIVEVAEHKEFDTVLYDTTTFKQLEDL